MSDSGPSLLLLAGTCLAVLPPIFVCVAAQLFLRTRLKKKGYRSPLHTVWLILLLASGPVCGFVMQMIGIKYHYIGVYENTPFVLLFRRQRTPVSLTALVAGAGDFDSTRLFVAILMLLGAGAILSSCLAALIVSVLPKRASRQSGTRKILVPWRQLGFALLVAASCAMPLLLAGGTWANNFFGLGVGLLYLGFYCLRMDQRKRARTLEQATSNDCRSPVLYLRSFKEEDELFAEVPIGVLIRRGVTYILSKNTMVLFGRLGVNFEEYFSKTIGRIIGPFVALGSPEDYLPLGSAARTYADDRSWLSSFHELASEAACILMRPDQSLNLATELTIIQQQKLYTKLFILTSPPRLSGWSSIRAIILRPFERLSSILRGHRKVSWQEFASAAQGMRYDLNLHDPGPGAVIGFDGAARAVVLTRGARSPTEFLIPIAARLGLNFVETSEDASNRLSFAAKSVLVARRCLGVATFALGWVAVKANAPVGPHVDASAYVVAGLALILLGIDLCTGWVSTLPVRAQGKEDDADGDPATRLWKVLLFTTATTAIGVIVAVFAAICSLPLGLMLHCAYVSGGTLPAWVPPTLFAADIVGDCQGAIAAGGLQRYYLDPIAIAALIVLAWQLFCWSARQSRYESGARRDPKRVLVNGGSLHTCGDPKDYPSGGLESAGNALVGGGDVIESERELQSQDVVFIRGAVAATRSEQQTARFNQQLRIRRTRLLSAVMTLVAIFTITGWAAAWWQHEEVRVNAEAAQRNASRALAALANIEAETGFPATAVRMALAALPRNLARPERIHVREAEGALLHSWLRLQELHRFGHEAYVFSVAFSPDGRTLATGSLDKTARLWDVDTGKEIVALRGHGGSVISVAFSPDGRTLATGSDDKTARLWEVATGKEIVALRGHNDAIWAVGFSPDGRTLASGSLDQSARLWEAATGREIGTLLGHESGVVSVAFSPDGRTLATGSLDKTARLWDVASRQEISVLRGHTDAVFSVAFSPDGRRIATGSKDKTARLWDEASWQEISVLRGHTNTVFSVAFSPDSRFLSTGSLDKTARLWEVETGSEISVLRGHQRDVYSVAFAPDGRAIATGSKDKTARLWDVARDCNIATARRQKLAGNAFVAFSPDSHTLATRSFDTTAALWEVATGKGTVAFREAGVWPIAVSPDFSTVATGSLKKEDYTVRLWELATGKEVAALRGHEDEVLSAAFSPNGRLVATGSRDKTVRLWEVATGNQVITLRGQDGPVLSITFSPDGRTLAAAASNQTRLWNAVAHERVANEEEGDSSRPSIFIPLGGAIATLRGHEGDVVAVAFSPDGRMVATGSLDATARLWDGATGEERAELRGHEDTVLSVAFSADGDTLATASGDKSVRLWDVVTGREIAVLLEHSAPVFSVAFSPDGSNFASGSGDGTVRLFSWGQTLVNRACACVHGLPLSDQDRRRLAMEQEWCTPEVSSALRLKLNLDFACQTQSQ